MFKRKSFPLHNIKIGFLEKHRDHVRNEKNAF